MRGMCECRTALHRRLCYDGRVGYAEWYEHISAPFRSDAARRVVGLLDRGLVALVACGYGGALAWLAVCQDARILRAVLVPLATFLLVTVVRKLLDAPRPYEQFDIDPIIRKDTRGLSLPSRHIASAVIIAFALAWLNPLWGALGFVACAVVAFTRIVGGVHFPRDVAAAAVLSALCGLVGFFVL
ncbi:MAG TPA: phosphatase PAP2 family protein [Eggerthellaceae bacterium]|nr:phosphatase PAP2 family protein [Eggerthellaceae bacterium]